jgi:magnesium-transporting ATPase (P-type)
MYLFVEIIRLFQSPLIKYDKNIFDFNSNKPSLARTSELPDELGQVNYILSDKTGTLTKNNMVLEHISIDDKIYSIDEISKYFRLKYNLNENSIDKNLVKDSKSENILKNESFISSNENNNVISNKSSKSDSQEESSSNSSSDKEIRLINNSYDGILSYENNIVDFFRLVNICNSIVINCNKRKEEKSSLIYQVKIISLFLVNQHR